MCPRACKQVLLLMHGVLHAQLLHQSLTISPSDGLRNLFVSQNAILVRLSLLIDALVIFSQSELIQKFVPRTKDQWQYEQMLLVLSCLNGKHLPNTKCDLGQAHESLV